MRRLFVLQSQTCAVVAGDLLSFAPLTTWLRNSFRMTTTSTWCKPPQPHLCSGAKLFGVSDGWLSKPHSTLKPKRQASITKMLNHGDKRCLRTWHALLVKSGTCGHLYPAQDVSSKMSWSVADYLWRITGPRRHIGLEDSGGFCQSQGFRWMRPIAGS